MGKSKAWSRSTGARQLLSCLGLLIYLLISLCLLYNVIHLSPRALLTCNLAAITLLQFRVPSVRNPPRQGQTNTTFLSSEWFRQLKGLLSLADLFNLLKPELNRICYLLALLAHHFFHVGRIRVKSLTLR